MKVANPFNTGITANTPIDTINTVRLVNILCIITAGSALTMGPFLTYMTHKPIMGPGLLEASGFMFALFLNKKEQYLWAAAVMLITQNLAAGYFGLLFGGGVPIKSLCIALGVTAIFIFADMRIKLTGLALSFIPAIMVNLNDKYGFISSWVFSNAEFEVIKWLADVTIYSLSTIVAVTVIAQLQKANKNKTNYLVETNHEITRSLGAINDIISHYDMHPNSAIKTEDLKSLKIASQRIKMITKGGLQITRIESGRYDETEKEHIDIKEWVDEVIADAQHFLDRKNLRVITNYYPGLPDSFMGDRLKLTMILSNLLHNALKYSYDNSAIVFNFHMEGQTITMDVIDFGSGIPQEKKATIFHRLFVSEKKGVIESHGIGLSLTKRLTELLGGTISFQSEKDSGARFTVAIPIGQDIPIAQPIITKDAVQTKSFLNGKTILIIEDDEVFNRIHAKEIEKMGASKIIQENDIKGDWLAFMDSYAPDILIIDARLERTDGVKYISFLRRQAKYKDLPILLVSSTDADEFFEKAIAAGATDYVKKPYNPKEFKRKIENMLYRRATIM